MHAPICSCTLVHQHTQQLRAPSAFVSERALQVFGCIHESRSVAPMPATEQEICVHKQAKHINKHINLCVRITRCTGRTGTPVCAYCLCVCVCVLLVPFVTSLRAEHLRSCLFGTSTKWTSLVYISFCSVSKYFINPFRALHFTVTCPTQKHNNHHRPETHNN